MAKQTKKSKNQTNQKDLPMVLQRRMPERRQFWFLLWHLLWLLLACAVLTVSTLRLSYKIGRAHV